MDVIQTQGSKMISETVFRFLKTISDEYPSPGSDYDYNYEWQAIIPNDTKSFYSYQRHFDRFWFLGQQCYDLINFGIIKITESDKNIIAKLSIKGKWLLFKYKKVLNSIEITERGWKWKYNEIYS